MHPLSPFVSTNLILPFHAVPSADWFRRTLRAAARFYRFISLQEVEAFFRGEVSMNSCCHVCFDDGDASFAEHALPVLEEMRIPATVFVSPKVVCEGLNYWFQEAAFFRRQAGDGAIRDAVAEVTGCDRRRLEPYAVFSVLLSMKLSDIRRVLEHLAVVHDSRLAVRCNLTQQQLLDASRSPLVTVGAHTMNHPVLQNEAPQDMEREIRESVEQLHRLTGKPVTAFAYPNGSVGLDFGRREQAVLREQGIRLAFSTQPGFFSRETDPLSIPRGGCPSLNGESNGRMAARLLLLPVWDGLRDALKLRFGHTETAERRSIRQAGLLPAVA